jgi:hypothetical protein
VGRSIAVVVCALLAREAWAQSPRAGGPAPGETGGESRVGVEANIAGNLARGFVDRDLIAARAILQGWTGPWGLYIQPYWLYGRVGTPMGKITTDNEIYVRTGLFRQIRETRFFAYAVSAFDRSVRRKIDYRELLGAGAGMHVLQGDGVSLLTSVGVLGEVANFKDRTLEDPDGNTFETDKRRTVMRWSVRIYGRYRLGEGKLSVIHDLIVIPAFTDPRDDYRILFFGAIDAPIAKGFSFRAQADATHEGLIVTGTKHGDLAITFGLAYKNDWSNRKQAPPAPASPKP